MSYQYTVTERRKRTTSSGGYGYSGNRSAFGYWIPLTLTVTAAAIGVAAWIWSERRDDEVDSSEDEHYPGGIPPPGYSNMSGALPPQAQPPPGGFQGPGPGPQQPGGFGGPGGPPPPPGGFQGPPPAGPLDVGGEYRSARSTAVEHQEETGLVARVSSAFGFGRSASPAPPNDWASKTIAAGAAGVAAAGAMVGGAISSLTGGSGGYEDHERWSEEADQRDNDREINQGIKRRGTADEFFSGAVGLPKSASVHQLKRKTVAIVVSAVEDTPGSEVDVGGHAVSSMSPFYYSLLTHSTVNSCASSRICRTLYDKGLCFNLQSRTQSSSTEPCCNTKAFAVNGFVVFQHQPSRRSNSLPDTGRFPVRWHLISSGAKSD